MSTTKKLVVILGPTAVGKTALSIQLAQHFQTEIISADSRQFFRELNIGVARPSQEELSAAVHHFIGFISVETQYSAGMFERDALQKLEELFQLHDIVICCGGSMMYVDALLYGLDELPSDKDVKQALREKFNDMGLSALQEELQQLDPEYYTEVDKDNPHRLMRGIEVCRITGEKYSQLRKKSIRERNFEVIKICLHGERQWIYNRINRRVDAMMEMGLLEEAKSVYSLRHHNALNTVGYKELFDHLQERITLPEAIDKIKQHTRNFAKRQLTWWRNDPKIHWVEAGSGAFAEVISQMGKG